MTALAAAVLLVGCGGGNTTSTGLVTENSVRLCVQTGEDTAECFGGAQDVLASAAVGQCVTVTWQSGGSGRVAEATAVAPSATACPPV